MVTPIKKIYVDRLPNKPTLDPKWDIDCVVYIENRTNKMCIEILFEKYIEAWWYGVRISNKKDCLE